MTATTSTATTSAERRKTFRRKALMAGTIRLQTQTSTYSCVVRNLSATGARLAISGAMWLPENFDLEIRHRDIRVGARAVWRDNTEMGIEFTRRDGEAFRSTRQEDQVRSLEVEREKLKLRVRQLSEEF